MRIANSQVRSWLQAAGVSLSTALLVVAVFFCLGNPWNGDIAFHAASWLDVAGQWREGIIYPRWMEWANFGFGEPRFIFYPPLSWMLGAALTFLLPWKAVPSAFVVIVHTLAGLSSYALARRFLSESGALLGAAFFAANPYALLDVYNRGALAEDLACALIPLVVLGALVLGGLLENRWRSLARALAFFAVVFAAVWLSDVPAAIVTSYSVALIFAWAAAQQKSLRPLWSSGAGLALAFGLNSFHLLPVLLEQHWASVEHLLPARDLLAPGNLLANNFLFYSEPAELPTQGWNLLTPIVSNALPIDWIASNVAILLLATIVVAGIVVYRRIAKEERKEDLKRLWRVLLLLSVVATFVMTRPSWIFWKYLPKLVVIQFPWRWIGVLAVPYAILLAGAIGWRRRGWIWGVAVIAIMGGTATLLVLQGWRFKRDLLALQKAIADDRGVEGTVEYYPSEGDRQNFVTKFLNFSGSVPRVEIVPNEGSEGHVPSADSKIEKWTAEERDVHITSREPVRIALRLLNYPAWRLEINGKAATPERLKGVDQVVAQVPAGESEIRVRFARTPDRVLGNALSAASLLALGVACWRGRSVGKHRQNQDQACGLQNVGIHDHENSSLPLIVTELDEPSQDRISRSGITDSL